MKKSDRLLSQGNKSMRYKLVDTNKDVMSVERMCRMMAVSVSDYYTWKERKPSLHQCYDVVLAPQIRAQFAISNQTYGAPRMHAELCEEGLSVGLHRVARLMRKNGQKAHRKRRLKRTTDSHHDCPDCPQCPDPGHPHMATASGPHSPFAPRQPILLRRLSQASAN